jgi:hypothetical protein
LIGCWLDLILFQRRETITKNVLTEKNQNYIPILRPISLQRLVRNPGGLPVEGRGISQEILARDSAIGNFAAHRNSQQANLAGL